jgi:PHD/YefM family antitoxin component YafN of YafNO toxin-antitoxin module
MFAFAACSDDPVLSHSQSGLARYYICTYTLDINIHVLYAASSTTRDCMRQINALMIRNHLGQVLDMLQTEGEPILISKGRKVAAVLITPEQYQRRFLDHQTEEQKRKMLEKVLEMRANRIGNRDSVTILRELRGYGA